MVEVLVSRGVDYIRSSGILVIATTRSVAAPSWVPYDQDCEYANVEIDSEKGFGRAMMDAAGTIDDISAVRPIEISADMADALRPYSDAGCLALIHDVDDDDDVRYENARKILDDECGLVGARLVIKRRGQSYGSVVRSLVAKTGNVDHVAFVDDDTRVANVSVARRYAIMMNRAPTRFTQLVYVDEERIARALGVHATYIEDSDRHVADLREMHRNAVQQPEELVTPVDV